MPLTAFTDSNWASILQYFPFIGMAVKVKAPNVSPKYSPLIARAFEVGILLVGMGLTVRDQGIKNREAIRALQREDNIIQIALVTEVGRLQEANAELKVTLKDLVTTLTEHRVNHP